MQTVNIHEAKTHLSRLIEQVSRGEPIIIAKAGKPMVKLVPISASDDGQPRRLGFLTGEIRVPDDFDRMLIGQATVEGILLLTADSRIGDYPGPIRLV